MQTRVGIGIVAMAGAAVLAGCGTIQRAKELKAIQAELALADAEAEAVEREPILADDFASAGPAAQFVGSNGPDAPVQASDTTAAAQDAVEPEGPNQPEVLTRQCPVDFTRFPSSMLYCPQHGTRLRDVPTL